MEETKRRGIPVVSKTPMIVNEQCEKKRRGRPVGSSTPPMIVNVEHSQCPKCGSIDRSNYYGVRRFDYPGTLPDGRHYTTTIWRNCRCLNCQQSRVDRTHE